MPRRPTTKGSRAARAARAADLPTPVHSALTTPLSSAYPSTYASEVEADPDDEVSKLPMGALSLSDANTQEKSEKQKPFRFMDLPSELRIKIYDFHFAGTGGVVDLDPDNYKRIHKKLAIFRASRAIYQEAAYVFYSTHTFRVFPTHPGRFFKTKKPLLARLNSRQRSCITSLELRLGPGWGKPPRGWVVNQALGLAECVNVRRLTVFVECDPSDGIFNGFRLADGFYEKFSRNLLTDMLQEMPFVDRLYFDAYPSVKRSGAMMRGLLKLAADRGLKISWGPERGWTHCDDGAEDVGYATMGTGLVGPRMKVAVVA
ncbi:hypothetical protein QBC47DRAFT_62934 [Echria macrotheca]|uniref:Uncharacterized protein n=1 Tax=Echria macrotheca TaxID=438768 RepID=A0AAJ0B6V9_9PEZI|nr:hypothetical protein QBC47DRAFT_62934 [Echria macrotheca]